MTLDYLKEASRQYRYQKHVDVNKLPPLDLPTLRPDQRAIIEHPAKIKILSMGRRWGKTVMSGYIVLQSAYSGKRAAWVVPTYKNARAAWRAIEQAIAPLLRYGVKINKTERVVEFPNGGFIGVYSADNPDSLRGDAFHDVVMDEGAYQGETVFLDVVMPTLADYNGQLIVPSTPNGKNWFHVEYMRGLADMVYQASFHAPTSANPKEEIQNAFIQAKARMPERTFREEWLAEFVEDGAVFRNVRACATAVLQREPVEGHTYIMGMDTAKLVDYSVVMILDTTTNEIVHIDRVNQIDYVLQLARLEALYAKWKPQECIIERNVAEMFIEQARRLGMYIIDFVTTNASKQLIIDGLSMAFEQEKLRIPDDKSENGAILLSELMSFAAEKLPGGTMRYGAPEGMHDDCVMALALVWSRVTTGYFFIGGE